MTSEWDTMQWGAWIEKRLKELEERVERLEHDHHDEHGTRSRFEVDRDSGDC